MNLDQLRRLFTKPLDKRVANERKTLASLSTDPLDCESYFKEVFAGQIL